MVDLRVLMGGLMLAVCFVLPASSGDGDDFERWIRQLGSDDYHARERAQKNLLRAGERARTALEAHRRSSDPEIERRVSAILASIEIQRLRRIRLRAITEVTVEGGAVHSVAVSADGKLLASGGQQGDIILWDVAGGARRATLLGHDQWVGALCFDPRGKRLVSAAGDVVLWDIATGQELERTTPGATTLDWSPDGRWIAFPSGLGGISVIDALRLEPHADLRKDKGALDAVAFSTDSRRVAFGNRHGGVATFDVRAKELLEFRRLSNEEDVEALAFLPDGTLIAALEGCIRCGATELPFPGTPSAVAVSADGRRLAAGGEGGAIQVWEVSTIGNGEASARSLDGHEGWVASLAFLPDSRLASAGNDGRVLIWSPGQVTKAPIELAGHRSAPESLTFLGGGKTLVISGAVTTVYDIGEGSSITLRTAGAVAAGPSPADLRVITGSHSELWRGGALLKRDDLDVQVRKPRRALVSPDQSRLVVSSWWGNALLNFETDETVRLGRGWEHGLDHAWSRDGSLLALACVAGRHGEFGDLFLFDRDGKEVHHKRVRGAVRSVAFHPDGQSLYWTDSESLYVLQVTTMQESASFALDAAHFRFLSPELGVSATHGSLTVLKVPEMTELRRYPAADIRLLAVASDGQHIAVATDARVILYRVEEQP